MNSQFSLNSFQFNSANILMKNIPPQFLMNRFGLYRFVAASLMLLAFICGAAGLQAASSPPERMTYQGFLVDGNGAALAPTIPVNYPVVFRIYDASDGGNILWAEQQIVTVDKGNFSVVLGEGTDVAGESHGTLSAVFLGTTASERYMGLTVQIGANNLTLAPRLRLLPSPYAFLASQAVQLVNPSTGAPFVSLNAGEATVPGNARFESELFWGSGAKLSLEQGGSIELGNSLAGSAIPFIDFHYGRSASQDYNVRLINDGDGRLSLHGGRLSFGTTLANTKLALYDGDGVNQYGLGIQGSQFRLHLNNSAARFSFLSTPSAGEVMTIQGNGNVGINSANPSHKFEVVGNDNVAAFSSVGANAYIRLWDNTGIGNRVEFASRGFGRAAIWSGDDHLNVLRNGRVGIGTINPPQALTVQSADPRMQFRYPSGALCEVGRGNNFAFIGLDNSYWAGHFRWASYDGDSNWDFLSDRKLKKDIANAEPMLDRALKVQVRRYRWNEDASNARHKLGVIAQEVQELFPDMVSEIERPDKAGEKIMTVGYGDFGVVAIKAIQELHTIVEAKDARIASLEREVAALKKQAAANIEGTAQWEARFAALEKMVAASVQPAAQNRDLASSQTR
jgi:hypothetical protein